MHGASEQCMQATEIDFSAPTMPSLMVTTRRRFTPQGTSFSFLQAVTQPLHSMQRSASHRNFILAMVVSSPLVLIARRVPPPPQARSIWQTVGFVSCIIVTKSYPYVVGVVPA